MESLTRMCTVADTDNISQDVKIQLLAIFHNKNRHAVHATYHLLKLMNNRQTDRQTGKQAGQTDRQTVCT